MMKMKEQRDCKNPIIFFLENTEEYARVAKAAIKKMKKVEQDYKSILTRYKEMKYKVEVPNEELT